MTRTSHQCPISGRAVGRRKRPNQDVADVYCPEYDRETGFCRLELELPRIQRWPRLLEALDEIAAGEGVHCVMQ